MTNLGGNEFKHDGSAGSHKPKFQNDPRRRYQDAGPSHHRAKDSKTFKLFISNIPFEFNYDKFKSVFASVAVPVSFYLSPHSSNPKYKWGFVEYESLSDSEEVIRQLHNAKPHYLQIKYANNNCYSKNSANHGDRFGEHNSYNRRPGRQSTMQQNALDSSSSDVGDVTDRHPPRKTASRNRSHPHPECKNIHLTVTQNGERLVEAEYDKPDDDYDNFSSFSSRLVAFDKCKVCHYNASKKCPACSTAYCSDKCAAKDWKHHISYCTPDQSPATSTPRDKGSDISKQTNFTGEPHKAPLEGFNSHPLNKSDDMNQNRNDCKVKLRDFPVKSSHEDNNKGFYSKHNGDCIKPQTSHLSNGQETSEKKSSNRNAYQKGSASSKGSLHSGQSLLSVLSPLLPLAYYDFTKVSVTHVDNDNSFWVVKTSDEELAFTLHSQLQEYCMSKEMQKVENAFVGLACAALFTESNEWCRAEVIAVEPCIKVRYMDYGNEDVVSVSNLCLLPPSIASVRALAFKIKISEKSTSNVGAVSVTAKLSVQPIKMEGNAWIVQVENKDSVPTTSQCLPNETVSTPLVDSPPIPKDMFTEVTIASVVDKWIYWVHKTIDSKDMLELTNKCLAHCTQTTCPTSQLSVGIICAAYYEELWFRAEILAVNPAIKVKFIDYGNEEICSSSDIRALPSELISIPPFAFKIHLASGTSDKFSNMLEGCSLSVKPVSKVENGWLVYVENEMYESLSFECKTPEITPVPNSAHVSTKSSTISSSKLDTCLSVCSPPIPRDTFTKVKIGSVVDKSVYWVQKTSDDEAILDLTRKCLKHCSESSSSLPQLSVGFVCAAYYLDLWYRAEILAVKPVIKVKFIDYGNEEICSTSNIKALPTELTSIPPYAFKIVLSPGTSDKYFTLVEEEELSIKPISQVGNSWVVHVENEVYECSSSVSKAVELCNTATCKSAATEIFASSSTNRSTKPSSPPPLHLNSFTDVIVGSVITNGRYWVQKVEDLKDILTLLEKCQIQCQSREPVSLLQLSIGDICAAYYQQMWFRAEVLAVKPAIKVKFIDYGNEDMCSLSDICSLPQELTSIPPYAIKIYLAPGTPDKYCSLPEEASLSIKPAYLESDEWYYHVENEFYDNAIVSCKLSDSDSSSKSLSVNKVAVKNTCFETPNELSKAKTIIKQEPPVPENTFTKVVLSYLDAPDLYWVNRKSDLCLIEKVLTDVNNFCVSNGSTNTSPTVGSLVLTIYDGDWYRAKVISCDPDLEVRLIDFGNKIKCSDVKPIPPDLSSIPPLAFKIKLAEGTSSNYLGMSEGECLSISPVSQCDDYWIVHIENENYSSESVPVKSVKFLNDVSRESHLKKTKELVSLTPPIALESFTPIIVTYPVGNGTYWVSKKADVFTLDKILVSLDEFCKSPRAEMIPKLTVGTLCSALFEGEWSRAQIVSLQPSLMVKFIDFGNDEICSSKDIRTLRPDLISIPPLAFKIKLADGTSSKFNNLAYQDLLSVKPVSQIDDETWMVHIENEVYPDPSDSNSTDYSKNNGSPVNGVSIHPHSVASATSKNVAIVSSNENSIKVEPRSDKTVSLPLSDKGEQRSSTSPVLNGKAKSQEPPIPKDSFTEVYITYPVNDFTYWASPVHKLAKAQQILAELSKHCQRQTAQQINEVSSGAKCAAKYMDEWYRAKIVNVSPLQVKFVDYGNIEEVSITDIKVLPFEFTKIAPMAFMIKLQDDVPKKYVGLDTNEKLLVKPISKCNEGGWLVCASDESSDSVPNTLVLEEKITFKSFIDNDNKECEKVQHKSPESKLKPLISNSSIKYEVDNSFLPNNTFTQVTISHQNGKGDYWVNIVSALKPLLDMTKELDKLSHQKVKPIVGQIYVRYFVDIWCRVKVISLKPLKVVYIDYGNEEKVELHELHPLPPEFKFVSPYAIRVRTAPGTNKAYLYLEVNSPLSVKPINKSSEGIYTVLIEGEKYASSPSSSPTATKSLVKKDVVTVNHLIEAAVKAGKCDLIVNRVHSQVKFTCTVITPDFYKDQIEKIESKMKQLHLTPDYNCKAGSMVGCMNDEGLLCRGKVITPKTASSAAQVALVDYGYCCSAKALCPLPVSIEQLPPAAVSCCFSQPQPLISIGTSLKCSEMMQKEDGVKCQVYDHGSCTLSLWVPTREVRSFPTVPVPSGSNVALSALTDSCDSVYIQPLTVENSTALQSIVLQTDSTVPHDPVITSEPEIGDVVACRFDEDNKFYRAQITNVSGNLYTAVFLDFGNSAQTSLDNIKHLPELLKNKPACSVKVRLEGVRPVSMIPEVKAALQDYIDNQISLTIMYNDFSSVSLSTRTINLNSSIISIINSSLSGGRIMSDQVKYADWIPGCRLSLLIILQISINTYLALNNKEPDIDSENSSLTKELTKYASTFSPEYKYTPVIDEIVVARFQEDGLWYRAVCKQVVNSSYEVFFLDYGNSGLVTDLDLRPLKPNFLDKPVYLRNCKIHGVPSEVSPEVKNKLEEMFSRGSIHEVVVSNISSIGNVTVYHPQLVRNVKQNLIDLPPVSLPHVSV